MNTLLIFWILLPGPVKLLLWIGAGVALAAVVWAVLPKGRVQKTGAVVFLAVYLAFPYVRSWIIGALHDYRIQKEAWLSEKCRELASGETRPAKSVKVEGFLIDANYDKLLNERFQRAASVIEKKSGGGGFSMTLGGYEQHPIYAAVPGGNFAKMAYALLTEKRFSFVEFEIIPDGYKGEYSNAGFLNTQGWSGKRYRLYYLAPGDYANCVNESGEAPQISGVAVMRSPGGGMTRQQRIAPARPMCLALEVTTKPISKYRLSGDESEEWVSYNGRIRGVEIPLWTRIRWDRLQVGDEGGEAVLHRYLGFNHPDEVSPRYRCNNPRAAAAIVGTVLMPDVDREFYRTKPWYQGSAVQRFYEPEKVADAPERTATVDATVSDAQCPEAPRAMAGNVLDQLDDVSRPARRKSVQSVVGGTQPASFFTLGQSASITRLSWSGTMHGDPGKEEFLIRVFQDNGGVPGTMIHESRMVSRGRSVGQWSGPSKIFDAPLSGLTLPAGDYWLSVLSSPGAQRHFFWFQEPAGQRPDCGSGGVTRYYDGGRWGGGSDAPAHRVGLTKPAPRLASRPPVVHRNARGYSFRLELKPTAPAASRASQE